jgi:flagellar export protein FliJ
MRHLINGQKKAVSEAENKVDASRERLKDAMVEKKTMENLKSKHSKAYIIEQRRKEQLVTDEITSYKYKMTISGD